MPLYLSHLAGSGAQLDPRRAVRHAVLFVLGFGTAFVLLGAGAGALGSALAAYRPFLTRLGGIAVIVFGLQLLGVWNVWRGGHGSAGLGLAFAVCWSPCVGPVLASLLVVAGSAGSSLRGACLLAAYAIGLGVPFIAAAASLGRFGRLVDRWRPYLPAVERVAGAVLIGAGLLLYFGGFDRLAAMFAA